MSSDPCGIDYAAVLADLEAKRAQLDNAIAGIRVMLGLPSGPLVGSASLPQPAASAAEIASDAFFGLSIPDAAKKFLAMRKRTATTPEIVDGLKRGGQQNAASENFANTVGSVLARVYSSGAGIVRVARGTWGLAEWYPNKPRKPGPKNNDDKDEELQK